MTPDLDELRQRAAEELTGYEAEIAEWKERFRAYDPEGAELLEKLAAWLEEHDPIDYDENPMRGPYRVAWETALGQEDEEIKAKGTELLHRLAAFRDETNSPYPSRRSDEDEEN